MGCHILLKRTICCPVCREGWGWESSLPGSHKTAAYEIVSTPEQAERPGPECPGLSISTYEYRGIWRDHPYAQVGRSSPMTAHVMPPRDVPPQISTTATPLHVTYLFRDRVVSSRLKWWLSAFSLSGRCPSSQFHMAHNYTMCHPIKGRFRKPRTTRKKDFSIRGESSARVFYTKGILFPSFDLLPCWFTQNKSVDSKVNSLFCTRMEF